MSKVNLELLSWLTETVGRPSVNEYTLVWEIKVNSSVKDLLASLARAYPRFKQSVFDTKSQKLNAAVGIFYNGCQLELVEGLGTRLKDGDTITMFPALAGG